jgi:PAS domain-containing protein
MHTVTSCDLAAPILNCRSTSILGPDGRTFYVSETAVYIWVTGYVNALFGGSSSVGSFLFRIPFDNAPPGGVGAQGAPVDQFSFHEDISDRTLSVLVRAESAGDAYWGFNRSGGAVALARIPMSFFYQSQSNGNIPYSAYRELPTPNDDSRSTFHNRFIGDYVLYGIGNDFDAPLGRKTTLYITPIYDPSAFPGSSSSTAFELPLGHGVDRIEVMGKDAVVVGSDDKNLYFSTINLPSGSKPTLGDEYAYADGSQAETRSHAYFFRLDDVITGSGVLGLPVARPAREAFRQLFENSASMVFLRRANGRFLPLGELPAQPESAINDNCHASCLDWYGNARPIFINARVFALMGYELVEAAIVGNGIREIGRINFAPSSR